jgi:hypothetical protein
MTTHIVGIDPGLRDTGVVTLSFDPFNKTVSVRSFVIDGQTVKTKPDLIRWWLAGFSQATDMRVFIEKFVPRPGMNTTPEMTELERLLSSDIKGSKLVRNTGVKQVINNELLKLFGVWKFDVVTNHDDLRSAARIALFGMAKDPSLNTLLADVVRAGLDGTPWTVVVEPGERYVP